MNIFISYSSKDRESVKTLAEDLGSLGHKVWFDQDLSGGQAWWDAIIEQIRTCELFIFALTPSALDSLPCRLEYSYANALGKRLLPVMLVDVNGILLPSGLTLLQYVDYRQRDVNSVFKLVRAFNLLPPARPLPDPLPPAGDAPISPLSRLRDQIDQSSLSGDEQILILAKLKDFLDDDGYAADARFLLERLREHPNLLARNEREIAALLTPKAEDKPAGKATPTKSTTRKTTGRRATRPLRIFSEHTHPVHTVRFSPDGERILSCSEDGTARLWHLASDESIALEHNHFVTDAAFSPDGSSILTSTEGNLETASGGRLTLWTITGEVWYDIRTDYLLYSVDYSPNDKRLLGGGSSIKDGQEIGALTLWDMAFTDVVLQLDSAAPVHTVTFSPNGMVIAAGCKGGSVRLWNATNGRRLVVLNTANDDVWSIAYSPHGDTLLTGGSSGTAQLWKIVRAQAIRSFSGHTDTINGVAYSPDGRYVLTGSSDTTARLWDAETGQQLRSFSHPEWVYGVAFSPDGKTILTGCGDNNARLWESGV